MCALLQRMLTYGSGEVVGLLDGYAGRYVFWGIVICGFGCVYENGFLICVRETCVFGR